MMDADSQPQLLVIYVCNVRMDPAVMQCELWAVRKLRVEASIG